MGVARRAPARARTARDRLGRAALPADEHAARALGHRGATGLPRRERARSDPADLVVIGNAVRANNPRRARRSTRASPYRSFSGRALRARDRGQALGGDLGHARQDRPPRAWWRRCCTAPGAIPRCWSAAIRSTSTAASAKGSGEHFVVEGDEYDTRVLRQDAEVPALPRAHAGRHVGRVRPRRHLPRSRAREADAFRTLVARMPARRH